MSDALDVRQLTVSFGGVAVVDDLSFTVAEGDSLAIIGTTGSGKTVLFRALIGALPYRGEIRWAAGAKVGYIPQKLDIERDLGALFTQGESLVEALFGKPGALGVAELAFGVAGSIGVAIFIVSQRHRLVIALVSRDLARTSGIDVSRLSLLYLLTFSVTVALGLRYLGVLLMGSLIIIPAAAAKHLAANLNSMLAIAVTIAIFSTLSGTSLAHALHRETGPFIIAIAAGVFFVSLLKRGG